MIDYFSLKDKIILVTGASSGIGREISIQCSNYGAKLVITGRNIHELNRTFSSLNGDNHIQIAGDITSHDFINNLVAGSPQLDGIVHSAGIIEYIPIKFNTVEKINSILGVNYTMPVYLSELLLKKRKVNNNASIVFLSSISGLIGGGLAIGSYAGSKAALIGTSKIMALELAKLGIRVNCLAPGMVKTEMTETARKNLSEEALKKDEAKYPLGYGMPSDVASSAIFLLSNASRWITGTAIVLDGGLSCT